MTTTPNGCQHCGVPRREHYQQWKPPVGWHQWAPPTQDQILARMKARRAARIAPPERAEVTPELIVTITADFRPLLDATAAAQRDLDGTPTTKS